MEAVLAEDHALAAALQAATAAEAAADGAAALKGGLAVLHHHLLRAPLAVGVRAGRAAHVALAQVAAAASGERRRRGGGAAARRRRTTARAECKARRGGHTHRWQDAR